MLVRGVVVHMSPCQVLLYIILHTLNREIEPTPPQPREEESYFKKYYMHLASVTILFYVSTLFLIQMVITCNPSTTFTRKIGFNSDFDLADKKHEYIV